jgi:6-phosphogluconate dehydrogenase
MGGNMAERLRPGEHEVVTYARNRAVPDVGSLAELVDRLSAPRGAWLMIAAGDATERTI